MHIPVLQKEVIRFLNPRPNENFIDCTIGQAGHTLEILKKIKPKGKILGIEWDPELYNQLREKCSRMHLEKRLVLINDSYTKVKEIVKKKRFEKISGILFDLGMSSWHLEESKRGFSFLRDEPLDMRYNPEIQRLTAKKIINEWPEKEIKKILREFSQEKFWRRIARRIIKERKTKPIETTFDLVRIIKEVVPRNYEKGRIHPATRVFQALRIAVNDELNNLKKGLSQSLEVLEPEAKLVVISFHSLEDRIVKDFFRLHKKIDLEILTKKPIRPRAEEIKNNPRARSAKLRAAAKICKF